MNTLTAGGESPLHLESLEARENPAGNVVLSVPAYGTIALTGDALDNQFSVSQQADGTVVVSGLNGTTINGEAQQSYGFGAKLKLQVDGGAGNDMIAVSQVNLSQGVEVRGGAGNDQIGVSQVSGGGVFVDAGAGDDYVTASAVRVSGSAVFVGGDGFDSVRSSDVQASGGVKEDGFEARATTKPQPAPTNPQDFSTRRY